MSSLSSTIRKRIKQVQTNTNRSVITHSSGIVTGVVDVVDYMGKYLTSREAGNIDCVDMLKHVYDTSVSGSYVIYTRLVKSDTTVSYDVSSFTTIEEVFERIQRTEQSMLIHNTQCPESAAVHSPHDKENSRTCKYHAQLKNIIIVFKKDDVELIKKTVDSIATALQFSNSEVMYKPTMKAAIKCRINYTMFGKRSLSYTNRYHLKTPDEIYKILGNCGAVLNPDTTNGGTIISFRSTNNAIRALKKLRILHPVLFEGNTYVMFSSKMVMDTIEETSA